MFDEIIERKGSNSYKWDSNDNPDLLPMWVADMDFRTAPAIIEALRKRVDHGVFGYTRVPAEYYRAITDWFSTRHGWTIAPSDVIYTIGVVPALSATIKALTRPGDRVVIQPPVYNLFFTSVKNNGCEVVENQLLCDEQNHYTIDFDNLSRAVKGAKALVLCNPHNPVGRVWSVDELRHVATICRDNNVVVISDEIHCELTYGTTGYNPFALVAEEVGCRYVVTNSPSKAFNTAGLQIANIVCRDAELRARIDRAINDNEVCDVNPFGVVGLIAAYNEGGEWLDSLRNYLWGNYLVARKLLSDQLPLCKVTPLEATYLMWIDLSAYGMDGDEVARRLLDEQNMRVSAGSDYGSAGRRFIRLNIACPRARVVDGVNRIVKLCSR